jgi:Polysaccharide lyase
MIEARGALARSLRRLWRQAQVGGYLTLGVLSGCEPELSAGEWTCGNVAGAPPTAVTGPVAVPWSTSFEDRFCDYSAAIGYCYETGSAVYDIVSEPVHSGRYAAAFSVSTAGGGAHQARCVRQGVLPTSAYYGAWYYIPAPAKTNGKNWNLLYFQGGDAPGRPLNNLWNVTLVDGANDSLELVLFGTLPGRVYRPMTRTPIPIGAWFHIELFLKRAADASGAVALYQDDVKLVDEKELVTDDGSAFEQWYVGNFSDGLTPANSTVYVDDVSIRALP